MLNGIPAAFWRSAELLVSAALVVLTGAVFYFSRDYPSLAWAMGGPPAFYPRLLAALLLGLSLLVAIEGIRAPTMIVRPSGGALFRILGGLAVLSAATALMHLVGFRIMAAAAAFLVMIILFDWRGARPSTIAQMAAIAIGASLVLAFVFEDLAGRRLPAGTLLLGS